MVQDKPIEAFRNMYANLALPLFAASEPAPPKVFHFNSMKWSLWDRWILEGDLTVQQVLDWFKVCSLLPWQGPSSETCRSSAQWVSGFIMMCRTLC